MTRQSEQLEREAEDARCTLAADLDELRHRITPGQIVDEVTDYARGTPVAEFLGNLVRDMRDNPLPLILIGAGVAWSIIASTRRPRIVAEVPVPVAAPAPVWTPSPPAEEPRPDWEVAAVIPAADS